MIENFDKTNKNILVLPLILRKKVELIEIPMFKKKNEGFLLEISDIKQLKLSLRSLCYNCTNKILIFIKNINKFSGLQRK